MAEFNIAPPATGSTEPSAKKDASGENFPVASRLLPKRLRPHVMAFYHFVRLGDDIADDPDLEPELKLSHLDALERALVKGEAHSAYLQPALDLHASLKLTRIPDTHARQVLQAFRRDAKNTPCRTWSDLMLYCRYSAAPVGRYLLDLHGEGAKAVGPSDALCAALQILNHLQDCREDWVDLGRCYIPRIWFEQSKVSPERLVERSSNDQLRAILDRTLDEVDKLLERAAPLPGLVVHRGLRLESAVILSLARALSRQLRRQDPLARRVKLTTPARVVATFQGIVAGLSTR
ncbi:squalene/phytoene synthase family protein [Skermanella mucosa]|uniref:squalene/phytoene synthase family protein n=1 Tax=Skermanella mucosa TaxID=1789672 RepID=UPI00192B2263|nr:squalene/phytoene synthase family protein [Skermanella mucosa]UEM18756.1 squalene/phytoene synthase family protein [Skermanella mucosa]